MKTATCNQCGKKMNFKIIEEFASLWVCHWVCQNPACSNYALLQVPLEQMPKGKDI